MSHTHPAWSSSFSLLRTRWAVSGLLVSVAGLAGCAQDGASVSGREDPVVYGLDDREDVYAHPSASLRTLATESIVALVPVGDVIDNGDGTWDLDPAVASLQEAFGLCDDERFLDQPTAAFCSGTLVAPDIVVTAGHCITSTSNCLDTHLVFDYLYTAEGELAVLEDDDVYDCVEILAREEGLLDYAYLRLDRPVTGHSPATISAGVGDTCRNVVDAEAVTVLGFGSGLPLKIDDGGNVTDASTRGTFFFDCSLDTFGGNSGSGVFNDAGEMVGVLSGGATDYVDTGTCVAVNELENSEGSEEIGHVLPTLVAYCDEASDPDADLCALAAASCPSGGGGGGGGGGGCSVGAAENAGASALGLLGLLGLTLARRSRRRGGAAR